MSHSPDAIANRDYRVNISNYFSNGWDLFKQYALPFVGYFILTILIAGALSALPYPLGLDFSRERSGGGIVANILSPVLSAGMFIVAFKLEKGQSVTFSDFFRGFNNFLQIFLVNLVAGLLTFVGLILLVIPGIYLAVSYFFAMPLVLEKRFEFWTALETSRKLVTKQWFSIFGFGFLIGLLNFAGALLCGLGLLVTVPWSICIIVSAYTDIVGLNGSSPDETPLNDSV